MSVLGQGGDDPFAICRGIYQAVGVIAPLGVDGHAGFGIDGSFIGMVLGIVVSVNEVFQGIALSGYFRARRKF